MDILKGRFETHSQYTLHCGKTGNTESIGYFLMLLYVWKEARLLVQTFSLNFRIKILFQILVTAINGPYLPITLKPKGIIIIRIFQYF